MITDGRIKLDLIPQRQPLIPASSPFTSIDLDKLKQLRILSGIEEEENRSGQNEENLLNQHQGDGRFLLTDGLAEQIVHMDAGSQVNPFDCTILL